MKVKLIKKLRKKAKEDVYLTHYYSENGKLSIILKEHDAPFGLTTYFYNKDIDMFCTYIIANYKSIEEALPDLQKARRKYILEILHTEYRTLSKGQQKREDIERLKQEDYQKYLQQF
jgi:hypothetical protein